MLTRDIPLFGQVITEDTRRYHIFVGAGQSNGYLGDTINPAVDVSGGRTFMIKNNQTSAATLGDIAAANEPLANPNPYVTGIGHILPFARDFYIPGQLAPRPDVMLLPDYTADTGFSDNRWNPGDDLFLRLMAYIGLAIDMLPNSEFKALMWMQGEKEAVLGWTQAQYRTAFLAFAAAFRAEFGEIPIIVGGMRPGWVAVDPGTRSGVQAALADMPNQLYLCGYADPSASPAIGAVGTGIHYSAAEQRLFGGRFWDAWQDL